ncbi:hypothetical protein COBT_000177 [Conglomerata obtusa]
MSLHKPAKKQFHKIDASNDTLSLVDDCKVASNRAEPGKNLMVDKIKKNNLTGTKDKRMYNENFQSSNPKNLINFVNIVKSDSIGGLLESNQCCNITIWNLWEMFKHQFHDEESKFLGLIYNVYIFFAIAKENFVYKKNSWYPVFTKDIQRYMSDVNKKYYNERKINYKYARAYNDLFPRINTKATFEIEILLNINELIILNNQLIARYHTHSNKSDCDKNIYTGGLNDKKSQICENRPEYNNIQSKNSINNYHDFLGFNQNFYQETDDHDFFVNQESNTIYPKFSIDSGNTKSYNLPNARYKKKKEVTNSNNMNTNKNESINKYVYGNQVFANQKKDDYIQNINAPCSFNANESFKNQNDRFISNDLAFIENNNILTNQKKFLNINSTQLLDRNKQTNIQYCEKNNDFFENIAGKRNPECTDDDNILFSDVDADDEYDSDSDTLKNSSQGNFLEYEIDSDSNTLIFDEEHENILEDEKIKDQIYDSKTSGNIIKFDTINKNNNILLHETTNNNSTLFKTFLEDNYLSDASIEEEFIEEKIDKDFNYAQENKLIFEDQDIKENDKVDLSDDSVGDLEKLKPQNADFYHLCFLDEFN